ncbi:MAG: hypothetical protein JNL02_13635 [Saprospiraceae bacterium]|nr:hypothetical protein [Saprospiraceae bacterium]
MKTPRSLLIWVAHVICWAVLIGLGFTTWRTHINHKADQLLEAAIETKADTRMLTVREQDEWCISKAEIHVPVIQFTNLINAHCFYDTLDLAFKNYLSSVPGQQLLTAEELLSRSLVFWDSMLVMAGYKSTEIVRYFDRHIWLDKKIWSSPTYRSMLNSPDARIWLQDLRLRNGLALMQAQISNSEHVDDRFFTPEPVFIFNPIYPYAGQSFDCEYFLEHPEDVPSPVRLRFWVNDREISASDSGFVYRDTFHTAGAHPVRLRAELKNIVAGTRESFERNYLLNVRLKN